MSMDKSQTPNEAALDFDLFEKNPSVPKDKAQLLIQKFGETANPANFTSQAQATNIQPTTLSLIFSIALYAASSNDSVDQTVIPENSRKKDKQKARVTADKQITNQSTKAKPDVKTSAKNSHKGKKSSEPEATQILTGYETVGEEHERI
ncbi:hypothetical protein GLOIN_2v1791351 [Rhizophagus irregularis DAOM 181602=DAOM 197198]|uniref:Uncharacterized protein n=1 Tax=Rhizophagus irregularis (strain DAOM 197198w) TaxID=1432141 RepID=A0A015J078_RHIIW|nr:hypothetical protein RirG_157000 [Rhizophagus irregularis DAOM 197198w]GBC43675.1 hypothetical protein GLOIN_2v1791351 [Rhizophagus irregularis DAOM 181602=DAOM 197198]